MKFNKIITSFFSIAAASLLVAACGSNEQTAIDETGKVDSRRKNIKRYPLKVLPAQQNKMHNPKK